LGCTAPAILEPANLHVLVCDVIELRFDTFLEHEIIAVDIFIIFKADLNLN
jgi:hypothetical protein